MDKGLVSIIIPYFNKKYTLQRSIDSILYQTYKNWEIIIIDDNSDIPLLRNFQFNDDRITVLTNDRNLGPGPTRQIGLNCAKGEFVSFLDADDWWDKEFLHISLSLMQENIVAVWSRTLMITEVGMFLKRYNEINHTSIRAYLLKYGHPICTSSFVWKRNKIGEWRNLTTQQDSMFEFDTSLICDSIGPSGIQLVFQDKTGDEHRTKYVAKEDDSFNKYIVYEKFFSIKYLKTSEQLQLFQWLVTLYLKVNKNNMEKSELIRKKIVSKYYIGNRYILKFLLNVLRNSPIRINS